MVKPTELAILRVGGSDFKDWESVMVRHAMKETPPFRCRFTCSEGLPIVKNFAKMRIKPGMDCEVTLAGIPAFNGKVESRQVFVDANRHYIEIQCATMTELQTSSVIHPTMEWKDKTLQQIGQDVLKKFGYNMTFEGGGPPDYKFPRVSAMHGESVRDFLDVLGRSLSQQGIPINYTTNIQKEFVVVVGPSGGNDKVEEGKNMLEGREIIYNPTMAGKAPAIAMGTGNNKKWGAEVTHKPYASQDFDTLGGDKVVPSVVINELPTSDIEHLKGRAASESGWLAEDQITVFATVQGWLRPGGGLWYRNQRVSVISPMLIMQGNEELNAFTVTFTQDNRTGTRTVLELRNANAAKGFAPEVK